MEPMQRNEMEASVTFTSIASENNNDGPETSTSIPNNNPNNSSNKYSEKNCEKGRASVKRVRCRRLSIKQPGGAWSMMKESTGYNNKLKGAVVPMRQES
eukprot:CAMPEP_0181289516 /NCGR_PEP_ID=MMETSP1101-20121128/922_1 /TAXON_ID=46948 /ORGANISM="Rhodomonas abbreviata, Strain Caron Lab Isolate" /LENGTH=98 /DNA_ID=CAMNT_0023393739 /DNA_START=112 /DNA_END=408 /DNA_ORIENTATION=-